MKKIHTDHAPKAVGPYSQAIISNGLVFCSGQIGLDPETGEFYGADISAQTRQAIENLQSVLQEAGSSLRKVVKTTCYLSKMSEYQEFNKIYESYFINAPARATVEVSSLPKGALVEIDAIAEVK